MYVWLIWKYKEVYYLNTSWSRKAGTRGSRRTWCPLKWKNKVKYKSTYHQYKFFTLLNFKCNDFLIFHINWKIISTRMSSNLTLYMYCSGTCCPLAPGLPSFPLMVATLSSWFRDMLQMHGPPTEAWCNVPGSHSKGVWLTNTWKKNDK